MIIEPDVAPFLWDDFSKTSQLVRAGEEAALKALPAIRAALEKKPFPPKNGKTRNPPEP